MLKPKTIDELNHSPEFMDRCVSLFLGFESGHMGADMYCDHHGVRRYQDDNALTQCEPMSGVLTWDEHAKQGTAPNLSRQSFTRNIENIVQAVGQGLAIVEYGPGTMEDAKSLIDATQSKLYIPVDFSKGIIRQAFGLKTKVKDCRIVPMIMDLFAARNRSFLDEPALAVLLGLTITNIPGAVPKAAPRDALIHTFENLKKPICWDGGYLLVSTHADQNGERNVAMYSEPAHKKFGVNFLYRIQEELPTKDFNPDYFEYLPVWHSQCSLIAHCVRATHDQVFTLGDATVSVSAGEIFHYNNSFKYKTTFFENCAATAGLIPVKKWTDKNHMMMYLFKVSPAYTLQDIARVNTRSIYSITS